MQERLADEILAAAEFRYKPKLTNKLNLPKPIYLWLSRSFYDHEAAKDTITATTLIKPVQEIVLCQRHKEEIEVDAIDQVWSVYGSGIHSGLERLKDPEVVPIERLKTTVSGMLVSGKFDLIYILRMYDYKVTSVWTLIYKSRLKEWRMQLSIYRYLFWRVKNVVLDSVGGIIAILRDWSERELKKKADYPIRPIVEVPLRLHSIERTEKWIETKIAAIRACEWLPDSRLPECSPAERWFNRKTGTFNKCESYCNARAFCHQVKGAKIEHVQNHLLGNQQADGPSMLKAQGS